MVRAKPPLPAIEGLFGKPTVVNNVLTLAAVTTVLAEGAAFYADSAAAVPAVPWRCNWPAMCCRGGLVELPYGASLRQLVEEFGGGTVTAGGRCARSRSGGRWVLICQKPVGHAAGLRGLCRDRRACWVTAGWWCSMTRWTWAHRRGLPWRFASAESCGKCTPCRMGSVRGVEVIDKIIARDTADTQSGVAQGPYATPWSGFPVRHGWAHTEPGAQRAAVLPGRLSLRRLFYAAILRTTKGLWHAASADGGLGGPECGRRGTCASPPVPR